MKPKLQINKKRELSKNELSREMDRTLRTIEIAATYSMQMFRNKTRTALKMFLTNLKDEYLELKFNAQFSVKRNIFQVLLFDSHGTEYKCTPNGYCATKSTSDDWKSDSQFIDTLESICQFVRDLIQDIDEANLKYKKVMELF